MYSPWFFLQAIIDEIGKPLQENWRAAKGVTQEVHISLPILLTCPSPPPLSPPQAVIDEINKALQETREAAEGDDAEVLKQKVQALSQATMKIGETLAGQSGGSSGGSSSGSGSSGSEEKK